MPAIKALVEFSAPVAAGRRGREAMALGPELVGQLAQTHVFHGLRGAQAAKREIGRRARLRAGQVLRALQARLQGVSHLLKPEVGLDALTSGPAHGEAAGWVGEERG